MHPAPSQTCALVTGNEHTDITVEFIHCFQIRVWVRIHEYTTEYSQVLRYSAFRKYSYPVTCLMFCCVTAWIQNWFKIHFSHPSTHNIHNDKVKTCFECFLSKCIENEIQKYHIYITIHTPLLWHSKLTSGASNVLWSSLRCHDNLESTCAQFNCLDMI